MKRNINKVFCAQYRNNLAENVQTYTVSFMVLKGDTTEQGSNGIYSHFMSLFLLQVHPFSL
jgi:hypothetical protein